MNENFVPAVDATAPSVAAPLAYEAPAIEAVVTLEELEREVHYAGTGSGVVAA